MPEEAVLLTLNDKSLYTNILLEDTRQIIENTLERRTCKPPPAPFLLELAEIVFGK